MPRWDVHCRVIDNHGDLGVSLRLARELARRGHRVRLLCDRAADLAWMSPGETPGLSLAGFDGGEEVPDVVVEAFGCSLAPGRIRRIAEAGRAGRRVCWVNLEYLSAESYVERSHGLPSPVHGGQAQGIRRWFFFPGFTPATGGLLRESGLLAAREGFDRAAWLAGAGVSWRGERVVSLFCYEPPALAELLGALQAEPTLLLVAAGRGARALRALAGIPEAAIAARRGSLQMHFLPHGDQDRFDRMLWCGDFNFVRGEDSLVRALWAGSGLAWQAYPQEDGAHAAKIEAFLDWLDAPPGLRRLHAAWNGLPGARFCWPDLEECARAVRAARSRALAQEDLVTRLERFVAENG